MNKKIIVRLLRIQKQKDDNKANILALSTDHSVSAVIVKFFFFVVDHYFCPNLRSFFLIFFQQKKFLPKQIFWCSIINKKMVLIFCWEVSSASVYKLYFNYFSNTLNTIYFAIGFDVSLNLNSFFILLINNDTINNKKNYFNQQNK